MKTNKNALVTGGAGFVGSHLCERLLNDGWHVVCIDNFYTSNYENISHLCKNEDFIFIDMSVEEDLNFLSKYKFSWIFNLACPASPIHYQKDPIRTTMTSVLGAYNVLNLSRICGSKVLLSSTSEIYGNPLVHPQTESYFGNVNPNGVRSCYDEGKRCAESLFFDFNRMFNVNVKVIRIFNTFGERMALNDGRVISNFIVQALKGDDITIYGDGLQTRSFQYISDLVDGMIAMIKSPNDFIGPVNIGNPEEYTMLELAKMIIHLTGSKSKIQHMPLPCDDPIKRKPNIMLANEKLGWKPKVSVEDGLLKTINYFERILTNKNRS